MISIMVFISGFVMLIVTLFSLSFFVSSIWEKEKRASIYAFILFIVLLAITFTFFYLNSAGFFKTGIGFWILVAWFVLTVVACGLLLIPTGANPAALKGTKGLITGDVERIDEKDTVFSKLTGKHMDLHGGNPRAVSVISEIGKIDGVKGSFNIFMGEASSKFARNLATPEILNPEISPNKIEIRPEEATLRIKDYATQLGAVLTGTTELNPLWIYSHYGRSGIATDEWGKEINIQHKYAIVFAQEMDVDLVNTAPHTPSMMESLHNYAKGAYIATQVARFIADMGYSAKVNQMAHYDAMMVPLAVDAGLGELSRMGYLITKEFGPRVRLSAVMTDLPLVTDKPLDIGVMDFCNKCKKCAHCCPSNSISLDERKEENGTIRWIIDRESCFAYWQKLGTDCCICMRVCPWSHARTFPHKLITEVVSRNALSRSLFNCLDNLFYGKQPPSKSPPPRAKSD